MPVSTYFRYTFFSLVVVISILFLAFHYPPTPGTKEILHRLFTATENIKTLRYHLKLTERIKGKMVTMQSEVKLQRKPRKLYLYLGGAELLWAANWNNGKALVNPGSFPYFNLNLDPYGSILRENQHHTIHEMGFDYLTDILKHVSTSMAGSFDKVFLFSGEEQWNAYSCYKITIHNSNYAHTSYKVLPNENIVNIARKLKVSEYAILELNPGINDYDDAKPGTILKVPTAYAKTVILYIDKSTYLPVVSKVFDEKGLFESYEYHQLTVNPIFSEAEFTKDYQGYHF